MGNKLDYYNLMNLNLLLLLSKIKFTISYST